LDGETLDLPAEHAGWWNRGVLRGRQPSVSGSSTTVNEGDAERGRPEAPIPDEGRGALEPPFDETLKALRAQPEQRGRAPKLKESNEAHHGRKATVWRSNHEDTPKEDSDRERRRKLGHDAPVAQEMLQVGWRDDAEETDPCDGETD
jgi:hypothetical protein